MNSVKLQPKIWIACLAAYNEVGMIYPIVQEDDTHLFNAWTNQEWQTVVTAPLYQQVVDWFRERHNITVYWNTDKQVLSKRIEEAIKLISSTTKAGEEGYNQS